MKKKRVHLRERIDAIVIGASAGGVEALNTLLPSLHASLPVPVIVVLHLPKERPSLLVNIFSTKCPMQVQEAQDKDPLEPGHLYFAPSDYHLLVDAGVDAGAGDRPSIALSVDDPVNFSRPSIDVLFESAAEVYGERLLGIVLTGASQDGAAGLATIHAAGGITIVQEPSDAQSPLMPESAIKRSPVDFVLPLEGIANLLSTLNPGDGT